MSIVLDVNIILSALIKDSLTRKIILESGLDFYFPEVALHKIRKYQKYVLERSGLNEQAYNYILITLFKFIRLTPNEEIKSHWSEAKEVMEKIDPEDVVFIAAALGLENSVVWSDDKHFDKQDKVIILKTEELAGLFNPKK